MTFAPFHTAAPTRADASGLLRDIALLLALLSGAVVAVYRAPNFVNQAYFLAVLLAFAVSRRHAVFFAFAFCVVSRAGNLFTGLMASGQVPAVYHVISFIDVSFIDLFLLVALVKAALRRNGAPLPFAKPMTWLGAYLGAMFVLSMAVEPLGLGELSRELRRLFTFSLLFSMPRLLPDAADFRRFAFVLMPVIVLLAAGQAYRALSGQSLECLVSGSDYIAEFQNAAASSRLTISLFESFLFALFGLALFHGQEATRLLPRVTFGLLALLAMLVAIASGTRIWIASYVLIWIGVALAVPRPLIERVAMFGCLAAGVLVVALGNPQDETISFLQERMAGTTAYLQGADAGQMTTADSSIDVRLNQKLPKLLGGIADSPLIGHGFTSGFFDREDSDLGALNILLQGGLIGLVLFLNLWWAVLATLRRAAARSNPPAARARRAFGIFCLGAILVDLTTISITGFHLPPSRIFSFATLLCFVAVHAGGRRPVPIAGPSTLQPYARGWSTPPVPAMIRVLHLYGRSYQNPYPARDDDRFYWSSWASSIARQLHQVSPPGWRMELWRPDLEVDEPLVREFPAFTARLFPSVRKPFLGEYSPALLRALRQAALSGPVLLHSHAIHSRRLFQAILGLRGLAPVVAQNHGDFRPFCGGRGFAGSLADRALEPWLLRKVDHFLYLRREERAYLDRVHPAAGKSFVTVGLDFAQFQPAGRAEAKRRLGLDPARKVLLYVGYLYELKGVHHLLDAFQTLKARFPLDLLLVGGREHDPLHRRAVEAGARVVGRVPHAEMAAYYQAADAYVVPAFLASGFDVSSIEASACGVPAVSTYLGALPEADAADLGVVPRDGADVTARIEWVLTHPDAFPRCRATAERLFSWPVVASRMIAIYRDAFATHAARRTARTSSAHGAESVTP